MTPDDWTREIRERLEKATPGPWEAVGENTFGSYSRVIKEKSHWPITETSKDKNHINNSLFIANAPTDIARLLEERKVLRDALEEIYVYAIVHFSQGIATEALAYVPQGVEEKK